MSKITIEEVANLAGVSASTVSRVVNESAPVSEEKVERVYDAINELGYRPNKFAHALRKGKSKVVGILVPDVSNPFFSTLVRGAEFQLHDNDLSAMICDTNSEPGREQEYAATLVQERVDGVLYVNSGQKHNLDQLLEYEVPVIAVDREPAIEGISKVLADNKTGSKAITNHLLEQGCEELGFIHGPKGVSTAEDRFRGFIEALQEAGLTPQEEFTARGDFTFEGGKKAIGSLKLDPDTNRYPDGFVISNALMAVGAIRKLEKMQLRVPRDIAVVGFDDILLGELINPPLTTVYSPVYDMGKKAVEILLDTIRKLEEGLDPGPKEYVFDTSVITRQSSLWATGGS